MTDWISNERMHEFLGRLKHPRHPDYDTIVAIEEKLTEAMDEDDFIVSLGENAGLVLEDFDQIVETLKEADAIRVFVDEQESAGFDGDTTLAKLKAGLEDYEAKNEAYWDIRGLCVDAGLLRPGDRTTDIVPLLRMFLPIDPPAPPPPPSGPFHHMGNVIFDDDEVPF